MVKPVPRKSASILSGRVIGTSGELPFLLREVLHYSSPPARHALNLPQRVATMNAERV